MIGHADSTADKDLERLAIGLAAARTVIGLTMTARPALLSRFLGVDSTTATRTGWAGRMVGVREVALGAGTFAAVSRGSDVLPWFVAQAVADGGDLLAMVSAVRRRQVWRASGALIAVAAAAGAVGGAYGAVRARG